MIQSFKKHDVVLLGERHIVKENLLLLQRLVPVLHQNGIYQIGMEFGASEVQEQLDRLNPAKREQVQKAAAMVGSVLIGKFITRDLVLKLTKTMGLRMTTRQASKYVPLAGQALSATLGYATLRYLGEQHIRDCLQVAQAAQLQLPAPDAIK